MKDQVTMLRNLAWVTFAGYIEAAVGLLAGVLIARTLGPTDYGHYAFGIWLCGVVIMAGNNGLPTSSIKFIAEARGSGQADLAAALVSRFTRMQMVCSGLAGGVFACAMLIWPLSDWHDHLLVMIAVALVGVWSRSGFWMWGSISKGHELFAPDNLTLALTAMLNLVLVVALAWRQSTVLEFFVLYALLGVVSNVLLRALLRRSGVRAVAGPIPDLMAQRLRRHVVLTGAMMLLFVGTNRAVEMSLLKLYTSNEAVGYFAIAGALTKGAVYLLAGGMAAVLLPAMSRRFGQGGREALSGILIESTRLYWFAGLLIAGLGLAVSDGLVHLLYGQRYDGAIQTLTCNLVIAGLVAVNGASAALLTASDRQADRMRIALQVLAVNIVAGLLLIPRWGLNGAIASLAITQLVETALGWMYVRRQVTVRWPLRPMVRQAGAAAVASALAWAVTEVVHMHFVFVVGAAVFVLVFVPLCVVLRTLRASEFEIVAHVIRRLGSPGAAAAGFIVKLRRFDLRD